MHKTTFAGLTALDPGEPITTDGSSFTAKNPDIIDHLLKIGARTHRHNAAAPLPNPATPPNVQVLDTGGALPSDTPVIVAYTLLDDEGGETLASPAALVTTPSGIAAPIEGPDLDIDYSAGTLTVGTYQYAVTLVDSSGGETPASPASSITRDPGQPNATITISGLATLIGGDINRWRLYRKKDAGQLLLLTEGTGDVVVDDGSLDCDCCTSPPANSTTGNTGAITVVVTSDMIAGAAGWRLYVSDDGDFTSPSQYGPDHTPADANVQIVIDQLALADGAPPDVATTVGGAPKLDPDTELLNWYWKQPVATVDDLPEGIDDAHDGDARMVLLDGSIWRRANGQWGPLTAAAAHWMPPVPTVDDLPASGNTDGDVRLTVSDFALHAWADADTSWHDVAGGAGGGGGGTPANWLAPVANAAALPAAGNTLGDVRLTLDTLKLHAWASDNAWHDITAASSGGGGTGVTTLAPGEKIAWQNTDGTPLADLWAVKNAIPVNRVLEDFTSLPDGPLSNQWNVPQNFQVLGGHAVPNSGAPNNTYTRQLANVGAAKEWQSQGSFTFLNDNWTLFAVGIYTGATDGYELAAFHNRIELRHQINNGGWVVDHTWPLATAPVGGVYLELDCSAGQLTIAAADNNATLIDNEVLAVPAAFVGTFTVPGFAGQWTQATAFALDQVWINYLTYTEELKASVGNPGFSDYYEATLVTNAGRTDSWRNDAITSFGAGWQQITVQHQIKDGEFNLRGQLVKNAGDPPAADEVMCTLDNSILGLSTPFSFQIGTQLGFPPVPVGSYDAAGNFVAGLVRLNDEGDGTLTLRWVAGRSSDPATMEPAVDLTPVHWYV